MSRRFVFVPIFGDTMNSHKDAWLEAPHVKAWGFLSPSDGPNGGDFIPIHTDPPCAAITLFETTQLFTNEGEAAVDVAENSTDLPDEVCLALAKMVLLPQPVSRSNRT